MISDRVINHWDTFVISDSSDHRLIVSVQSKINVTLILSNYRWSTWNYNLRSLCDSNGGVFVLFYKLLHAYWIGLLVMLFGKPIMVSVKIYHYWGVTAVNHWFVLHHRSPNTFFKLLFSTRWVQSTLLPLDLFEPLISSPVDIDVSFKHLNLPWLQALNLTDVIVLSHLRLSRTVPNIPYHLSRCPWSTQLVNMGNWRRFRFRLDSVQGLISLAYFSVCLSCDQTGLHLEVFILLYWIRRYILLLNCASSRPIAHLHGCGIWERLYLGYIYHGLCLHHLSLLVVFNRFEVKRNVSLHAFGSRMIENLVEISETLRLVVVVIV